MRLSDEHFVTGAIFLLVALMVIWFFGTHGGSSNTLQIPVAATPVPIPIDPCGQVVRSSCEMLIKEKTSQCNRDLVESAVGARLAEPMADSMCEKSQLELANGCPPDCVFDYATLVLVPGKVQFDFFDEPDENGQCFVRARRAVTMQGKCTERLIPAPPEPGSTPG